MHVLAAHVLTAALTVTQPADPARTFIAAADAVTAAALSTQDDSESTFVIYDVRDLASLITPEAGPLAFVPTAVATPPALAASSGVSPFTPPTPAQQADSQSQFIEHIAAFCGAEPLNLIPGVVAITADRATHNRFQSALTALRNLTTQRYELDLVLASVANQRAPAPGARVALELAGLPTALRLRRTVTRQVPARVESLSAQAFVADWQPVVAQSAVAFDPEVADALSGISLFVTLAAGPDNNADVLILVTGAAQRTTVEPPPAPARQGSSDDPVPALPTVQHRPLTADLRIPLGVPTALAVVPGYTDGESLILWATVNILK